MQRLRVAFAKTKFVFWAVFFFSGIYNFFYKKITKKFAPLPHFSHLKDLEESLERFVWSKDEFTIFRIKFPHFIVKDAEVSQWEIDCGENPVGDCDDWASYAAKALQQMPEVLNPCLLAVHWTDKQGEVVGHVVAVYRYRTQKFSKLFGHIGNWGHFRGYNSVSQVAKDIAKMGEGRIIAYATATPDLKLIYHEKI